MPRISRLKRNEVAEPVGVIYDRYMQQRGNVPNMFRTIAHRPEILQTMIAHFEAILTTGTLSTKLKELVIVRTSQLNACDYCLASHSLIANKLGWSEAQVADLASFAQRDDFTPAEKAALRLAESMTLSSNAISDAQFAELRGFYDEGEIVELLAAIGLFNYFNRFNNVLQMEPTAAPAPVPAETVPA
jgi:uncharacterized peroxidase-related enzyme